MADEDRALFDAAFDEEQPATEAVQEEPAQEEQPVEQSQAERPRDEHGRFAPKAPKEPEQQPVQATQEQQPQADHRIPLAELLNERERRQKVEREAEELRKQHEAMQAQWQQFQRQQQQPPPEVPDIFENPQGYQSHIEQTFNQRLREQELNFSLRLAHMQYKQEFEEAYASLQRQGQTGNTALVRSVVESGDPGEALMRWHRQQKLYEQTGGDLEGYFAKKQEELLNDPAFLAKAVEKIKAQQGQGQQQSRPVTQLPPSLNRLASAAPRSDDDDEDESEGGLLRSALRR